VCPDVGDVARPVAARSAKEDAEKWVGQVVAAPDAASWLPRSHRLVKIIPVKTKYIVRKIYKAINESAHGEVLSK
jgi:hypothetical protein